jgi:hypothetical protein
MGTLGVGIINSMAFSLLANISVGIDENQEIEVTFRSLSIFIEPSGLTRLLDPVKSDLLARKPETVTMTKSSEGSSSEVNSLVSVGETQMVGGDKIKLDMEEKGLKVRNSIKDLAVGGSGSLKAYIRYARLSLKQTKKMIMKEMKKSTGKSTKKGAK